MVRISSEDKGWAFLGYLGVLCLLPLFLKRDRSFVQFHAKQGLVITIIIAVLNLINFPLGLISLIPFINVILFVWYFIMGLIIFILIIFDIIGIINVLQGKSWKMPFISSFAERIKV